MHSLSRLLRSLLSLPLRLVRAPFRRLGGRRRTRTSGYGRRRVAY